MNKKIRAALALAGCYLALPALAQDLVISNARILDGTGNAIERGTVVVRGGRIAAVGANATARDGGSAANAGSDLRPSGAPANAVRIDAGGRTVMPGFIDAHRHIVQGDPARWLAEQSAANMREFLEAGFTTVLSAIDAPEQILELRRRTESGETLGPRIISAALVPLSPAATKTARPRREHEPNRGSKSPGKGRRKLDEAPGFAPIESCAR